MKIAIIGAGISGMSMAHLLKNKADVTVYERDKRPGGMIKCDRVNGHLFHRTGGHVFNTKNGDVLEFFWSFFNRDKEFIKADRNSGVSLDGGKFVPYPIENHIYHFDDDIVNSIINDLLEIKRLDNNSVVNFEEFLIKRFGRTLYEIYFQPYNEKVWRRDLTKVPLSWLEGKLPMPSVEEILFNNIKQVEEKKFVHSSFFYPVNGGSQFVADRFAEGLNIKYESLIEKIVLLQNKKWKVEDDVYDRVIFCGNIKQLPKLVDGLSNEAIRMIESLESHGTTSVLCEIDDNPYSWIYLPSRKHESHRIICSGNFSISNRGGNGKMSGTIEFTDSISHDAIQDNLKKIPWNPHFLASNYEKYTYPIQDVNTRQAIKELKASLEPMGIYLCGRFAEWEYYNMDVCMASAIETSKRI